MLDDEVMYTLHSYWWEAIFTNFKHGKRGDLRYTTAYAYHAMSVTCKNCACIFDQICVMHQLLVYERVRVETKVPKHLFDFVPDAVQNCPPFDGDIWKLYERTAKFTALRAPKSQRTSPRLLYSSLSRLVDYIEHRVPKQLADKTSVFTDIELSKKWYRHKLMGAYGRKQARHVLSG